MVTDSRAPKLILLDHWMVFGFVVIDKYLAYGAWIAKPQESTLPDMDENMDPAKFTHVSATLTKWGFSDLQPAFQALGFDINSAICVNSVNSESTIVAHQEEATTPQEQASVLVILQSNNDKTATESGDTEICVNSVNSGSTIVAHQEKAITPQEQANVSVILQSNNGNTATESEDTDALVNPVDAVDEVTARLEKMNLLLTKYKNVDDHFSQSVTLVQETAGLDPIRSKTRASGHVVTAYEDDCNVLKKRNITHDWNWVSGISYAEILHKLLKAPETDEEIDDFMIEWALKHPFRLSKLYLHCTVGENISLSPRIRDGFGRAVKHTGLEGGCKFKQDVADELLNNFSSYASAMLRAGQHQLGFIAEKLEGKGIGSSMRFTRTSQQMFSPVSSSSLYNGWQGTGHREVTALLTSPLMIKFNPYRPAKTPWVPTDEHKTTSFIEYLEEDLSLEDVQDLASAKKLFYEKNNIVSAQPFVVLCGQTKNIKSSYVVIDVLVYKCDSPLEAVDLGFKSIYNFNSQYPFGAVHVWSFFAQFFYEIGGQKSTLLRCKIFHNIEPSIQEDIIEIFEKNRDPFEIVSTEDKRLRLYTKIGLYEEPVIVKVENKSKNTDSSFGLDTDVDSTETAEILYMGIEKSFSELSRMDGLLQATIDYKDALMETKDRKRLGNDPVLSHLIHELIKIEKYGFEVTVKSKVYKIYLILSLILGDNLGLNSLLAYVSSFTNTHCCRICEASPDEIRSMVFEIKKLLRTKEKYEADILQNCTSHGLTGYPLFNEVPDYHVLRAAVDVMHDVFEGVVPTVMSRVLIELIIDERVLEVKNINDTLDKLDSDSERSNKPLHIEL
ncbi:hypothetical protein QAD02_002455, partial [Eretmocerus hayati]